MTLCGYSRLVSKWGAKASIFVSYTWGFQCSGMQMGLPSIHYHLTWAPCTLQRQCIKHGVKTHTHTCIHSHTQTTTPPRRLVKTEPHYALEWTAILEKAERKMRAGIFTTQWSSQTASGEIWKGWFISDKTKHGASSSWHQTATLIDMERHKLVWNIYSSGYEIQVTEVARMREL